mmetsp:Transcript_2644/g.3960  ORF Transcript_2644/g.3960 Transcript_2644/m.3960 type:complete len:302 (-) Transcript_2644:146-1051(-)
MRGSICPDTFDDEESIKKKRLRSERFKDHLHVCDESERDGADNTHSPKRFKGLSIQLERPYLRLTSAPVPSVIRPLKVLKLALENVKQKYLENEDYSHACEQLKSIRQDLTVQNINNRFAAHVYETHGRIALECGDLAEYNQCQSRLQEMRRRGIPISSSEFDSYRVLHALYCKNKLETVGILRDLARRREIDNEHMAFMMSIRRCLVDGNTSRFFKLYSSAPLLSGYILDYMVSSVRKNAYDAMIKANDTVSLGDITKILGFSKVKECKAFLKDKGAVVARNPSSNFLRDMTLDCKLSRL